MSYTAKRMVLLLMAWGLLIFVGVTVRVNLATPAPLLPTPTPAPSPTPAPAAADRIAALQTTLAGDPNNLAALLELGRIYYDQHDWDNAIRLYQKAAAVPPSDPDVLAQLATAQLYALRFGDARQNLTRAVALAPDRPDLHLLLGLALGRGSPADPTGATAEWRKVLALAPGTDLAKQAQALLAGPAPSQ